MKECLEEGILQAYFDAELATDRMECVTSHLASCLTCAAAAQALESESELLANALAPEFEGSVPTERLRRRIEAAVAGLQVVGPNVGERVAVPALRGWWRALFELFAVRPQRVFGYASLVAVLAFAAIFAVIQLRRPASAPQVAGGNGVQPQNPPSPSVSPSLNVKNVGDSSTLPQAVATHVKNRRPAPKFAGQDQTIAQAKLPRVKLLPGERSYLKTIAALDSTIKTGGRPMQPALQAEYERNLAFVDRALAAARTAAKSNPSDPDAAEFVFAAYQSKVNLLNTVADARVYNREQ